MAPFLVCALGMLKLIPSLKTATLLMNRLISQLILDLLNMI
jgi:hypothetical protein